MQEHKRTKFVLGALAALIILAALWRVMTYQPGARPKVAAQTQKPAKTIAQEMLPPASDDNELTGEPPADKLPVPTLQGRPQPAAQPVLQPVFITEKQPYPAQSYAQTKNPRQPYPSRRYGADSSRVVQTNFYAPDRGPSAAPQTASARTGAAATPNVAWNSTSTAMQEERAGRMLSPFMRTSRKDRERMNAQWNKLSAAIDRAVFQALMPKSKQEAMIEKYAPKPAQTAADPVLQSSGLTGAFAPVGQALSAQKQEIMKDFARTFGGGAAQQAGSLMDSFARELGSALNTPGLTQAQAAKRVQEISKKYQDKMNELADKNQYDKFMADRLAQDNEQKTALHNLYPDGQVTEQINGYIDTASQQLQELIKRTDLSQEEQSAAYAKIEQDKRFGIQNAILESGQSLTPFHIWEQDNAQKDLGVLKEKIEKGEVESVARAATPKETSNMRADFGEQTKRVKDKLLADPRFGKQAVEEVTPIFDNYENQLKELYQKELSPETRREQEIEIFNNLNRDLNRELLQNQMEKVRNMNIPDEQKQQALDEIQQAYNNIR